MHLDECYRRLREYCAGIETDYRYVSWEHAIRLRALAVYRRIAWPIKALDLEDEARGIEAVIWHKTYATIKPGIQTGQRT